MRKDDFKFLEVRNRKYYRGDEKEEEESESEKEEEENEEDDYEPPIFQPRNVTEPVSNTMDDGYKAIAGAMEGENWDDELEEVMDPFNVQYDDNYFNNIYQHPRPKTLAEAGYVVDDYLCLPYDIHVQPVSKDRAEPQIEDGQFDDDSEEDGT